VANKRRALLEEKAFARRITGFEAEHKTAAEREAVEAKTAAKKALQAKIDAAAEAMLSAFGGDVLNRQIKTLEVTCDVIHEVNAARAQSLSGDGFVLEVPNTLKAAMLIQLLDPETLGICWNRQRGDMRPKTGRQAA